MKLSLAIIVFTLVGTACSAQETPNINHISGNCGPQSHTAEGQIGEDLTARQVRYYCNDVGVAYTDEQNDYLMVVFRQQGTGAPSLGFEGHIEKQDPKIMDVEMVFLKTNKPVNATSGMCKLFFEDTGNKLTGIYCGARIDAGHHRTVASVVFNTQASQ
jgi:hypothetical protein